MKAWPKRSMTKLAKSRSLTNAPTEQEKMARGCEDRATLAGVNTPSHDTVSGAYSQVMNVLLPYPEFPDTFWSFKHALKFIRKRASLPPLGLLTVAAMLPPEWAKRLVDVNGRVLPHSQELSEA
jgi:hypothetical protein